MTTHPTPNDSSTTEEIQLVISDFGERRASDSEQSIGRKYYGDVEFWAPEVRRFHKYSFASDIYAVGYLMADMIEELWKTVLSKTGNVDRSVPLSILDIVNWCVSPRAEDRPNATKLREKIEELHMHVLTRMEDESYQIVFTDMVQAPELYRMRAHVEDLDISLEGQIDEDGIPY